MEITPQDLLKAINDRAMELHSYYRELDKKLDKLALSQNSLETENRVRARHNGAISGAVVSLITSLFMYLLTGQLDK